MFRQLFESAVVFVFIALTSFLLNAEELVSGTFVQKKYLHDVELTLVSSGTWTFEKDKSFTWNTLKPVPSVFVATPTNYSFAVGGKVISRSMEMKITDLSQVFEMREMKGVVERVERDAGGIVFKSDGMEIPSLMRVFFKNGDRMEISLKR
jgi:hypothetical protein